MNSEMRERWNQMQFNKIISEHSQLQNKYARKQN